MYTAEQRAEFLEAAKPLIQWLNDNVHPHHHIVVDSTSAQLVQGQMHVITTEYLRD
jgi:hypothetical protein